MFPTPRHRNLWRVVLRLSVLSLILVGLLPATVQAAEGQIGWHNTQAFCDISADGKRRIWHASPQMKSVVVSGLIGAGTVRLGNTHPQWASFRAHVLYSTDAQTWQVAATGSWFSASVGDVNTLDPTAWYNADSGQWEWGRTQWDLNLVGYYRVAVEYYWWPSPQMADDGYTYEWASDHVDLTNPNPWATNPDYCTVV